MSGPYLFLTPHGLGGRSILVNFSYVLRAEPSSDGKGTSLMLVRDSDPDHLKSIRIEESLEQIALRLQVANVVSGELTAATPPAVDGFAFQPQNSRVVEPIFTASTSR